MDEIFRVAAGALMIVTGACILAGVVIPNRIDNRIVLKDNATNGIIGEAKTPRVPVEGDYVLTKYGKHRITQVSMWADSRLTQAIVWCVPADKPKLVAEAP